MTDNLRTFTGRGRQLSSRRSVVVADHLARGVISVGGIGTILAVLLVAVFLLWVVVPLFLPARIEVASSYAPPWDEEPVHIGIDEYGSLGWVLLPSGSVEVFRLDSGSIRARHQLLEPGRMTSASVIDATTMVVLGRSDGAIQLAEIGFEPEIVNLVDLPADLRGELERAPLEAPLDYGEGVAQRISSSQARLQVLNVEIGEETFVADAPIRRVTHAVVSSGPLIAAFAEAAAPTTRSPDARDEGTSAVAVGPSGPRLLLVAGEEKENFLTGRKTLRFLDPLEVPLETSEEAPPLFLGVSGTGNDLYAAWEDGTTLRYDITGLTNPTLVSRQRLVPQDTRLASAAFVLGNNTLVWGDSTGRLDGGFLVRAADLEEGNLPAGAKLGETDMIFLPTKHLGTTAGEVLALARSPRSRLIVAGTQRGEIDLYNVTLEERLGRLDLDGAEPIRLVAIAPKENGLAVETSDRFYWADLDPRDSEVTFASLFRPIWYEGYAEPLQMWQSSSATDDFEPKYSLTPLVFGTVKATFYSMLFGAPLALLAAIFTSEFLDRRIRAVVKPSIELMASLPSVVLGFLAALVFAPFVERVVPAVLSSFVTVPFVALLGAYLWQLLPDTVSIRLERLRFLFVLALLPFGLLLATWLGPIVERAFFSGDLRGWLAWDPGMEEGRAAFESSVGGWMMLLVPLSAAIVAFGLHRFASPLLKRIGSQWAPQRFALADFFKFALGVLATTLLALLLSWSLDAAGFDPRGGLIDTYGQRNALIVGFVMGFAIIPIIYTISEDALTTVPEHLRSASLGAGATKWQTAVRIIIPTAMSGLFSALMIGLGRAVGETMIVLMAAGNTPVMDWNIFQGFRTLSANIAVELPEAVQGSTHYRTLFLAALVLFILTFAVNTVAEIVRLRFRKRAYQL